MSLNGLHRLAPENFKMGRVVPRIPPPPPLEQDMGYRPPPLPPADSRSSACEYCGSHTGTLYGARTCASCGAPVECRAPDKPTFPPNEATTGWLYKGERVTDAEALRLLMEIDREELARLDATIGAEFAHLEDLTIKQMRIAHELDGIAARFKEPPRGIIAGWARRLINGGLTTSTGPK